MLPDKVKTVCFFIISQFNQRVMSIRKEFIENEGLALVASRALVLPGQARVLAVNRLPQTICRWCFPDFTIEKLCKVAKQPGIEALESLDPEDTAITKRYGLQCLSTPKAGGLKNLSWDNLWNVTAEHDKLGNFYEDIIQLMSRFTSFARRSPTNNTSSILCRSINLKAVVSLQIDGSKSKQAAITKKGMH